MNLEPGTNILSYTSLALQSQPESPHQNLARLSSGQVERERYLFRCLFSFVDWTKAQVRDHCGQVTADKHGKASQESLLSRLRNELCPSVTCRSAVETVSFVRYSWEHPLSEGHSFRPTGALIDSFVINCDLSLEAELVLCLALLNSQKFSTLARSRLEEKLDSLLKSDSGSLCDLPTDLLELVVSSVTGDLCTRLRSILPKTNLILEAITSQSLDTRDLDVKGFIEEWSCQQTEEMDPSVIQQLARELGYSFTDGKERCEELLKRIAHNNNIDIGPPLVARVLGAMCRSHLQNPVSGEAIWGNVLVNGEGWDKPGALSGADKLRWEGDAFVMAVASLVPNMDWKEVVKELDHHGLAVHDRPGLDFLWQVLLKAFGGPTKLPMELIYSPWHHAESQFWLLKLMVTNPDIVKLSEYIPYSKPEPVQHDKNGPVADEENPHYSNWKSMQLNECLLNLSDHPNLTSLVEEFYKIPLENCADSLVVVLLQLTSPMVALRQELLLRLFPHHFAANAANTNVIMAYAWGKTPAHLQPNIQNLVKQAMVEYYNVDLGDGHKLSRILEIAQEIKALPQLLTTASYPFVIDLACLASRREYLKLDKWMVDNLKQGESFATACMHFLTSKCPHLLGGVSAEVEQQLMTKAPPLTPDTITTMLCCLNTFYQREKAQPDMTERIIMMMQNSAKHAAKGMGGPQPKNPRGMEAAFGAPLPVPPAHSMPPSGPPNKPSMDMMPPHAPFRNNPPFNYQPPTTPNPAVPPNKMFPGPAMVYMNADLPADGYPDIRNPVSKEIEDEANSYFQRIYNQPQIKPEIIHDFLEMLKKFNCSTKKNERDVFACMIKNLFEEYRFFPSYPDKELTITAQLFGGIIDHDLLSYNQMAMAQRYILDPIRKPQTSKMVFFAIVALDGFKTKLKTMNNMCALLKGTRENPSAAFNLLPEYLQEWIEYGVSGKEPANKPQGSLPVLNNGRMTTAKKSGAAAPVKSSIASAANIDTLLGASEKMEKIIEPSEQIQDKIGFIINNLSQANVNQKADEFRELVNDELFPWFSQYLVMKRASIEHNFHSLYVNFLDTLKSPSLYNLVLNETFRNIRVLLRSDKELADFTDRSLLKSLGHWLGLLTIARNKPILQHDIDLKALLIEAYNKGQQELLYVVPFMAKILESCIKSRVFRPNNPWTMGLVFGLAELHQEPGLKLNLKFEIEVLCKNLHLDIGQVKENMQSKGVNMLKNPDKYPCLEPPQLSSQQVAPNVAQQSIGPPQQAGPPPTHHHMVPQSVNKSVADMIPIMQQHLNMGGQGASMVHGMPQEDFMPPAPQMPAQVAQGGMSTTPVQQMMPNPQYSLREFNSVTHNMIGSLVNVPHNLPLFQQHPNLKVQVKQAVERAIQEWLAPVIERCLKIALVTCEHIVRKDFALDPDDVRLRMSLHQMVRSVTAGMVMITCKEPLFMSISNTVKNLLTNAIRMMATQPNGLQQYPTKEQIEQVANAAASDNVELACCFIQKTAMDKALLDIDKKFTVDFENRKAARKEGKVYCDHNALNYQERMPEQIRLKLGAVTPAQMAVYDEFARNVPGFATASTPERFSHDRQNEPYFQGSFNDPKAMATMVMQRQPQFEDCAQSVFEKIQMEIEMFANALSLNLQPGNSFVMNMHVIQEAIQMFRNSPDLQTGFLLIQKTVDSFLEGLYQLAHMPDGAQECVVKFREIHLYILKALAEPRCLGHQFVTKSLTRVLVENPSEEFKYNLTAWDILIRSQLSSLQMLDMHLAQCLDQNVNYAAVSFAKELASRALPNYRENGVISDGDFNHTIEALYRWVNPKHINTQMNDDFNGPQPEMMLSQRQMNSQGDFNSAPMSMMHSGMTEARNSENDPPGLQEKTEYLLRDWVQMYNSSSGKDSTKAFQLFVQQMNMHGILKTDDLITKFFRLATEMCVELTYRQMSLVTNQVNQQQVMSSNNDQNSPNQMGAQNANALAAHQMVNVARNKCFLTLDAYVRLIALLVKLSGDTSNPTTKVNLLNKVLGIIAGVLVHDHDTRNAEFRQLAYHRMFLMLFLELTAPEPILEVFSFQTLMAFCNTLHALHPHKVPGFAFSWLELISHRMFLARMLALTPQQKAWGMFAQLLNDLFKFLAPYLRNMELTSPIQQLYKGTIRVLLVLLHDFPEFLVDYHYGFCDLIPPNCVQMRNLILSAFPRHMRLPDPFTPNLKVENLPENLQSPRVLPNFASIIVPLSFRKDLDSFLKTRQPSSFLDELTPALLSSQEGFNYKIPLINAIVLYVGTQAISHLHAKNVTVNMQSVSRSAFSDVFEYLMVSLDNEGRYILLNAIANQLRFPNSHTQYFSSMMLHLFSEKYDSTFPQEQITRVLLERLIVNRPHPWGLLVTFIELMKNPQLNFWEYEFIRCAPEIEKLFDSVARSCVTQAKPASGDQN